MAKSAFEWQRPARRSCNTCGVRVGPRDLFAAAPPQAPGDRTPTTPVQIKRELPYGDRSIRPCHFPLVFFSSLRRGRLPWPGNRETVGFNMQRKRLIHSGGTRDFVKRRVLKCSIPSWTTEKHYEPILPKTNITSCTRQTFRLVYVVHTSVEMKQDEMS